MHNSLFLYYIIHTHRCYTDIMILILEGKNIFLAAKTTESDNSGDMESTEFLNGPFDARIMHLFNHGDDPSSSEEEDEDL